MKLAKQARRINLTFIAAVTVASTIAVTTESQAYPRPGMTRQIDVPTGSDAEGSSYGTTISQNGRYVAFDTTYQLDERDVNQETDVYVRDLKTGKLWIASVGTTGATAVGPPNLLPHPGSPFPGRALSWDPAISGDGRYVAFSSNAVNLVPGDANLASDVFLFDRKNQSIQLVSRNSDDEQGQMDSELSSNLLPHSWSPSLDLKGRVLAFSSVASNMSGKDGVDDADVFVRNLRSGKTEFASAPAEAEVPDCLVDVSIPPLDTPAGRIGCSGGPSDNPSLSVDGRFVAFDSGESDLVAADTNGVTDVFVRDLVKNVTERVSVASDGSQVGAPTGPFDIGAHSRLKTETTAEVQHAISADGRYVVFTSDASGLVPSEQEMTESFDVSPDDEDVFVHDRKTGRTERVSVNQFGEDRDNGTYWTAAAISPDGRFVSLSLYRGADDDLPRDGLYVHDRATGSLDLVATIRGKEEGIGRASDIARRGRYVSFQQQSPNYNNVFVHNRGLPLGTGGLEQPPKMDPPPDDRICIEEICVDPGGSIAYADSRADVPSHAMNGGADIHEAGVAFRPQLGDLFVRIELEDLPSIDGNLPAGSPGMLYGMRFAIGSNRYEVRATSAARGTFGLFDCTDTQVCRFVGALRGGFGTTGERIVFSLPLEAAGAEGGAKLSDADVFSAWGTYLSGASRVIDTARLART